MSTTTTKTGMPLRGKLVIAFLAVAILGGLYFGFQDKITSFAGNTASGGVINIGVNTWPGFIGGQYMNDGFAPNLESRLYKEYGIQVEFKLIDDFLASRKAFESGEIDLLWVTADALPTEMGRQGTMAMTNSKFIFQVDWSRGGDAIVADQSVEKFGDLKGKKVAVAEGTPSHSLLIKMLQANNMTLSDVELVPVTGAIEAANMFKQGAVPAAVVWSPDDIDCVKKVAGAKVLVSSKEASNIIADGFIVKADYLAANKEKLQKLYDAWMIGAAEVNSDFNGARQKSAKILADKYQMNEVDALAMLDNVRLTNHGDNKNFFGLGDATSVTGDLLYTSMAGEYQKISMVESPLMWKDVSDVCLVKGSTLSGNGQLAEVTKKFTDATDDVKSKTAYSTKKVTINFPTGSYTLTGESKAIITREFAEIARTNGGARIRIEGNTDNTGNADLNKKLSQNRAQAVADYMTAQYHFDPKRFIVIGNGSKHAINDGVKGSNDSYRTTDFELIKE
jgi:NitT/TauT family transport system substrate-binding protein